MAYDNKLGYDPDLDYTAAYAAETDPMNREWLAKGRAAKKAAMTAAGTYNSAWDSAWNNVYNANPVNGMDSSGSFGAWGNTPVGQLFGNNQSNQQKASGISSSPMSNPTSGGSTVQNAYSAYALPASQVTNPYIALQQQAQANLANMKQTQTNQVNQLYNNQAKQAYVQREQNTANMPKQLAAQGITGGMAESTAARIGTAYGNQLATNEAARMGAINDINIASDQQAIDMALQYADRMIAQQNADRNYGLAYQQYQTGVDQWNRSFDADQAQRGIDNVYRQAAYDRGIYESDRGFAYQQGRDAVSDNQWLQSFNRGVLESDRAYDRDVLVGDRNYNRSVLESDRNFYADEDQRKINNAYNQQIFDYNAGQDAIRNALNQAQFDWGQYTYGVDRQDNLNATATNNAYTEYNRALVAAEASGDYSRMAAYGWTQNEIQKSNANAQGTSTSNPYAMSSFARDIVSVYAKDNKFDIANALGSALISGQISPQDYDAALILTGVNPQQQANTSNAYAKLAEWTDNPANLGFGPLTDSKLYELIAQGLIIAEERNGKIQYKRK